MNVKEAVRKAKEHVDEMFAGENLQNVGLEEVVFDDPSNCWLVTVGFSRVWEFSEQPTLNETLTGSQKPGTGGRREYKVIEISDKDGEAHAIRIREFT